MLWWQITLVVGLAVLALGVLFLATRLSIHKVKKFPTLCVIGYILLATASFILTIVFTGLSAWVILGSYLIVLLSCVVAPVSAIGWKKHLSSKAYIVDRYLAIFLVWLVFNFGILFMKDANTSWNEPTITAEENIVAIKVEPDRLYNQETNGIALIAYFHHNEKIVGQDVYLVTTYANGIDANEGIVSSMYIPREDTVLFQDLAYGEVPYVVKRTITAEKVDMSPYLLPNGKVSETKETYEYEIHGSPDFISKLY